MHAAGSYELLDAGDERRLERFGPVVVDRPAPAALGPRRDPAAWNAAVARYAADGSAADGSAGRGRWTIDAPLPEPWLLDLDAATLELRPTETGQLGVFPEHAVHWPWLRDRATEQLQGGARVEVLHLFAYTGGATLAVASTGAAVAHVDASRPTVAWARRNAERSAIAERPVRWIVDDAAAFVAREVRRGRRYAGLVLDPPTYGHGPAGRPWRLASDLDDLLAGCASLLTPGAFVLLTAHTPGEDPGRLADRLADALAVAASTLDTGELDLVARSGVRLILGAWARRRGGR